MTPGDLDVVARSWAELRESRAELLAVLTRCFDDGRCPAMEPSGRAEWLLGAVEELVGLLPVPSRLADRARAIGATWPDPRTAPSFAVEGLAWMEAAATCLATWSEHTAAAWRQAWLLLSDVLAAEALSPFTDLPPPGSGDGAPS